jgi:hypothetical protein
MIMHHKIRPKNEFLFWIPKSCDRLVWSKNVKDRTKAKGFLILSEIEQIKPETGKNMSITMKNHAEFHLEPKTNEDFRFFLAILSLLCSNPETAKTYAHSIRKSSRDSSHYTVENEDEQADDAELINL